LNRRRFLGAAAAAALWLGARRALGEENAASAALAKAVRRAVDARTPLHTFG